MKFRIKYLDRLKTFLWREIRRSGLIGVLTLFFASVGVIVSVMGYHHDILSSAQNEQNYQEQQKANSELLHEHLDINCENTFIDPAIIDSPGLTDTGNPYFVVKSDCQFNNVGRVKLSITDLTSEYIYNRPDNNDTYGRVIPQNQIHAEPEFAVPLSEPIVLDGGESKKYRMNILYPMKSGLGPKLLGYCQENDTLPLFAGLGYNVFKENERTVLRVFSEKPLVCPKADSKEVYDLVKPSSNDVKSMEVVAKTSNGNLFKFTYPDNLLRYNLGYFN